MTSTPAIDPRAATGSLSTAPGGPRGIGGVIGALARLLVASLLVTALAGETRGDNTSPVYLEIEEQAPGRIRATWKVPRGQGLPRDIRPVFPETFKVIPPHRRVQTGDAVIETWHMIVPESGLAGARIRIDGLERTTTDGLVRVRFADGSAHRAVLRPTETATVIPDRTDDAAAGAGPAAFFKRWSAWGLLAAAFALSLLPMARRRGIVLCTAALVAGIISGHALAGLPAADRLFARRLPTEGEAARVLHGLMLNTYRAFMLQDEEAIYDTLARSVSGEFLSDVYLQNREKLLMRDAEGAISIVHQLDIKSVEAMVPKADGHMGIVASWDVYGSVHHQNHVHYRCNTYMAEVVVKPSGDHWKLVSIQLLDEQRVL